jgi:hypothetical protein
MMQQRISDQKWCPNGAEERLFFKVVDLILGASEKTGILPIVVDGGSRAETAPFEGWAA